MNTQSTLKLFHGSSVSVPKPDLNHSRVDIDFGAGFYLTEDERMAKKWAAGKNTAIVNAYKLDVSGLKVYEFSLDREWLDFVKSNRLMSADEKYVGYDVLIGPTAEDKLYDTLREYLDGTMTANETIKVLNVLGYSNQIVLKSEKALATVEFVESKELHGLEKDAYRKIIASDRRFAFEKTLELKRH